MNTKDFILENKIIVILRRIEKTKLTDLCDSLIRGGIRCIEITVDRTGKISDTADAIKTLRCRYGDSASIGAGTVMTSEQLRIVADAGAEYIVSPDTNPEIIKMTRKLGLISIPGAFTATEIASAYRYGADFVKVFPAGSMGPGYIKSLKAPFPDIPLLAVGGITLDAAAEYIKSGACGLGLSGMLVNKDLLDNNDYDSIEQIAKRYVDAVK